MSHPAPTPGPPATGPQDHPQTTTILIMGILGLAFCGVLGPFAWSMGNKALREIDGSNGQIGGRDTVNVGRILGMVATILLGIVVAVFVVFIILIAVGAYSASR